MTRNYIFLAGNFLFLILIQVLILRNLALFDIAFAFVYIGFILLLPFEFSAVAIIVISFITGLTVDVFYDSMGLHAAASVAIGFLRKIWSGMIIPRGGYEIGSSPNIKDQGFQWYLGYALPLIFIHHLVLFFLEASGFTHFFFIFSKVISSTVFTFIILLIGQYLFRVTGTSHE